MAALREDRFRLDFQAVSRDRKRALESRVNDKPGARLIQQTVLGAGLRPDLPATERLRLYSSHSLLTGLASSAEDDQRHVVHDQPGHASAEITRRNQRRRDRFRVNLTKAAGISAMKARSGI